MQNRLKQPSAELKTINECPACGQMSFPSKNGIFSPSKEEPKNVSPSTLPENKSENSLGDCPACGMMSFVTNGPSK